MPVSKNYKKLLSEASRIAATIKEATMGKLYDLVTKLIAVDADKEFHDDNAELSAFDRMAILDGHLAAVNMRFDVAKRIMGMFPKKDEWTSRTTRELIAEALYRDSDSPDRQNATTRKIDGRYDALRKRYDELLMKYRETERRASKIEKELKKAYEQISKLKLALHAA